VNFLSTIFLASPQRAPWAIAAFVVLALVTVVSYFNALKGKPIWWWLMPALRLLAIALLAVSVVQPVNVRTRRLSERGPVVLLVDQSRSMSVIDTERTPAQKVSLAAALGQLPANARDRVQTSLQGRIDRLAWMADSILRVHSELDYAQLAGRGVRAAQARLTQAITELQNEANAALMISQQWQHGAGLAGTLKELANPPTGDEREKWIGRLKDISQAAVDEWLVASRLSDEWIYEHNPAARAACDALSGLSRAELVRKAIGDSASGLMSKLKGRIEVLAYGMGDRISALNLNDQHQMPDVVSEQAQSAAQSLTTNLVAGVRAVIDSFGKAPVRAIVLLSDGRKTAGRNSIPTGLSAAGVPIFAVDATAGGGVVDVSAGPVTIQPRAVVDELVPMSTEVNAYGRAADVDVTTNAFGEVESRHVHVATTEPTHLQFTGRFASSGLKPVQVKVSNSAGEATLENNTACSWVDVIDQKVHVFIVAPIGSEEAANLNQALAQSGWADVSSASLADAATQHVVDADRLADQDVIVLIDVAPTNFDLQQWAAIRQVVNDRGSSVIFVPGNKNWLVRSSAGKDFESLLPFDLTTPVSWRISTRADDGFRVVPTTGRENSSVIRLSDDADTSDRLWRTMPALKTLFEIDALKTNAKPLLEEANTGKPMLTEISQGAGNIYFFAADATANWQTDGDRRDAFWLNLIRRSVEDVYPNHSPGVWMDVRPRVADSQQRIVVRIKAVGEHGTGRKMTSAQLQVLQKGATLSTSKFNSVGNPAWGRLATTLQPLPVGEYELRADAGAGYSATMPLSVRDDHDTEMLNVSGDMTILHRLADASGGAFLSLDQINALPDKLLQTADSSARPIEFTLWDSGLLYGLVVLAWASEWMLRKHWGLA